MPTIYKEVEVDIDLDDFDDYELIDELERRGKSFDLPDMSGKELVTKIWEKRRLSKNFDQELDELIYLVIGRVV